MAALWKIVLHGRNSLLDSSNEVLNVFGYRSNLTVINEVDELDTSFRANVLPPLLAVLANQYSAIRIEYFNVTDGVGYKDSPIIPAQVGGGGGAAEPGFVAWSFKYQRASIGKRSGGKRFGPISDGNVSDGQAVPAELTVLNALADALAAPLPLLLVDTWFPEILERKPAGVYPWTSHPISGVIYQGVSSQNSRKR